MKKYLFLVLSLVVMTCSKGNENESYRVSDDGKTLYYLDYMVEKKIEIDDGYENHIMVLKSKDGKEIKRFELGCDIEEMNTWKIEDLIKGDNKELIITQFSGGAHCCEYNWIYEFNAEPKEIFSSHDYGSLGFMADPEDINDDGNAELILQNLAFSYFYRCCYAASPSNSIIFEYDTKLGKYVIQNIKFAEFIIGDYDDNFEISSEFENIKPTDNPDEIDPGGYYLGEILSVVIPYLYVGREEKGWEIFDRYYKLNDSEEIKERILERLKGKLIDNK